MLEYRYYLGDAGFRLCYGIVVLFSRVRYYFEDYRESKRKSRTKKELYNLRYVCLRIIVERAFG